MGILVVYGNSHCFLSRNNSSGGCGLKAFQNDLHYTRFNGNFFRFHPNIVNFQSSWGTYHPNVIRLEAFTSTSLSSATRVKSLLAFGFPYLQRTHGGEARMVAQNATKASMILSLK